jgi:hypothetical protein
MYRKNSNEEEYISLTEATKYCDYSQEYLSLRARQGKLKAEKFGRNWVTTKEWVEEYFGKTNSSQARAQEKKTNGSSFSHDKYFFAITRALGEVGKIIGKSKIIFHRPELRYAIAGVLVFIFLGAGFMHACPTLSVAMVGEYTQWLNQTFVQPSHFLLKERAQQPIYIVNTAKENVVIGAASVSGAGKSFYDKYAALNNWVEDKIIGCYNAIAYFWRKDGTEAEKQVTKKDVGFVGEEVDILEENIISDIEERFEQFRESAELEEERQGVIITPLEPGKEAKDGILELKDKFSDEVEIQPVDESSGIITPIFREKKGDEYLYLMVPIKE